MAALAGPAISGISSLIGGIFGRPRASTSTSSSTSTQNNEPIYNPKGFAVGKNLAKTLIPLIQNPTVDPALRTAGRNQINDTYDASSKRLDSILAARGYGTGGKANLNTLQMEGERAKSFGNLESDLYKTAIDRQMQALGLGAGYSRPVGFNTTTTTEGTNTQPGMPIGQAVGGAIGNVGSDLGGYFQLLNLLKKGGSSAPSSSFGDYSF